MKAKDNDPPLHKTGLHPGSLSARVFDFIEKEKPGLLGLAAAAEVIAADCRQNAWIATDVKKADPSDEWWDGFLGRIEANNQRCDVAMEAFALTRNEEALCAEMQAVAASANRRSLDP